MSKREALARYQASGAIDATTVTPASPLHAPPVPAAQRHAPPVPVPATQPCSATGPLVALPLECHPPPPNAAGIRAAGASLAPRLHRAAAAARAGCGGATGGG